MNMDLWDADVPATFGDASRVFAAAFGWLPVQRLDGARVWMVTSAIRGSVTVELLLELHPPTEASPDGQATLVWEAQRASSRPLRFGHRALFSSPEESLRMADRVCRHLSEAADEAASRFARMSPRHRVARRAAGL